MAMKSEVSEVRNWFASFTSIGGLSQNFASKGLAKLYWLILFLIGFYFTVSGLVSVLVEYSQHEVLTEITIGHNYEVPFPSVTICNVNRVHCGNLNKVIMDCNQNETCTDNDMEKYCSIFFLADCAVSVKFAEMFKYGTLVSNVSMCERFPNPAISALKTSSARDYLLEAMFYDLYLNLTWDELLAVAHQPQNMITGCSYDSSRNHKACLELITNPVTVFSPRFGMCYVFNFARLEQKKYQQIGSLNTTAIGPDYGLSLTLNLEVDYYMRSGFTDVHGAIVTLQSHSKMPSVLSDHISISTSRVTNIGVSIVNVTRKKSPYTSHCVDHFPKQYQEFAPSRTEYSAPACNSICFNKASMDYCGCIDPLSEETSFQSHKWKYCSINATSKDAECIETVVESQKRQFHKCPCNVECHLQMYQTSVNSMTWPSDEAWARLAEKQKLMYQNVTITYDRVILTQLDGAPLSFLNQIEDGVRKNFLKVNIFLRTKSVQDIAEVEQFTFMSLLSSLGGALSLYLGITLVSIFEVLELLVRFLLALFNVFVSKLSK